MSGAFRSALTRVGADAHIGPLGTIEFAERYRVSVLCTAWADVGIGPYEAFKASQSFAPQGEIK